MTRLVRAGLVAVVFGALVGCGQGSMSKSHGDDTPSPAPVGPSVTAAQVDSLLVPADQLPGGLHGGGVGKQPQSYPPGPKDPCYLADAAADDVALFGSDLIAFRNVRYSGPGNVYVDQAIGVYKSNSVADAAFSRLVDSLHSCQSGSSSSPAFTNLTRSSASWQSAESSTRSSGEAESIPTGDEGRSAKNVLIRVSVGHFADSPHIAASVADQIVAKINNAA